VHSTVAGRRRDSMRNSAHEPVEVLCRSACVERGELRTDESTTREQCTERMLECESCRRCCCCCCRWPPVAGRRTSTAQFFHICILHTRPSEGHMCHHPTENQTGYRRGNVSCPQGAEQQTGWPPLPLLIDIEQTSDARSILSRTSECARTGRKSRPNTAWVDSVKYWT